MTDELRYTVVKYVPDHVRYEPINIGCAVFTPDMKNRSLILTKQAGRLVDTRGIPAGSKAIKLLLQALEDDFDRATSEEALLAAFGRYGNAIELTPPLASSGGTVEDEAHRLYDRFVSFETTASRHNSIRKPTVVAATRRAFRNIGMPVEERFTIDTPVRPVRFDFKVKAGADQLIQCFSLDSKTGDKISEIEAFAHQAERVQDFAKEKKLKVRLHAVVQLNRREPDLNDAANAILREVGVHAVENQAQNIDRLVTGFGESRRLD